MSREVSVRKLNQQTSAVLNEVAQGHVLTINHAGKPIARIVPITELPAGLRDLIASGEALAPTVAGPPTLPSLTPQSDTDIAAAIERDRQLDPW